MNKLKFVDLFCGIGGFRIALENCGGEFVFSCDIDKYARETYHINFGDYPEGDITKIESHNIPKHDILCAGFPCQPFSIAGRRLGFEDSRGTLFFEVARILKDKQPKAFILENVAGITNHDNKNTISVIERTLNELGYQFKWKLMNASKYGIPQNRNRWYCIGFRKDLHIGFDDKSEKKYVFPEERKLDYTLNEILSNSFFPEYEITKIACKNLEYHYKKYIISNKYNDSKMLIANEIRPSKCSFRCDGISPCLTAKMGTGGNNVPVIVSLKRKFTEKECLKIMGFPDDYIIRKNNMQSYKQIGNSVVVPIVYMLAREMFDLLGR